MNAFLLTELRAITGDRAVISSPEELRTYECDGLTNFRVMPRAVLLPTPPNRCRPWCASAIASGFPSSRAAPAPA